MNTKALIRIALSKEKVKLIMMGLALIVTSVISIIIPYFNSLFLDYLIYNPKYKDIISLAAFIVIIGLTNIVINYFSKMCGIKLTSILSFDLFLSILKHMQRIPYQKYKEFDPTYLHQRISSESNNMISFIVNNYISFFFQAIMILIVLFIIFCISKLIFILCLLFIPSYLISYTLLKKPLFNKNKIYKESQNTFFNNINEQFVNMKNIKAEVLFNESINESNNLFKIFFNEIISFNRLSTLFSSLDSIFSLVFQAFLMILGGTAVLSKNITIGQFNMILMYFGTLISCVKYYFNLGLSYQSYKASEYRLNELLSINIEKNGFNKISVLNTISLAKISFKYNNFNTITYPDCCFSKNLIYCVYGKNGVGKSTLIDLILGIVTPTTGEIQYNDYFQDKVDLYDLRRTQISVVLQNPYYSNISGLEFLRVANEKKYTISEIEQKIIEFGITNLFKDLDLKNYLSKKISQLSGGERQKLLLLRMFMKDSTWMLLDEPSSFLDNQSIESLANVLSNLKKDRMILIITHDPLLQSIADKEITL